MTLDPTTAQQMLGDIKKRESKLNDWEAKFIDSVQRFVRNHSPLSIKQENKLSAIWERVTD